MIAKETSDNVQGFGNLATRMENLRLIFSKAKLMESEGTGMDMVNFLEKLEACVSIDIH
jgi:hypothetical protein